MRQVLLHLSWVAATWTPTLTTLAQTTPKAACSLRERAAPTMVVVRASVVDAEEDDTGCPEDDSGVLDDWEDIVDTLSVDDGCHQSPDRAVPPVP
jgi:hypothetical protein